MPLRSPHLFIISAPSGAGKTTLCREVHRQFPQMLYSVSYTSRKPRKDEQDGIDYHFIDTDEFKRGIGAGRWAEWALVHSNYYGTSADFLDEGLRAGKDILLDLDVQGTRQMLERYTECVAIFIRPPSLEALRQRLEKRGTDSAETIAVRLGNAEKEMAQQDLYHHVIVNDQFAAALKELISVIEDYGTPH
ncbi:MAG: guanylate kinase [Deltaproteobacteria bacterium]|nr:guanylate kinase [Deltaproteobacteria bacterium]